MFRVGEDAYSRRHGLLSSLTSFLGDETGQTLTEYIALVIGGLLVLVALVFLFGVIRDLFYSTGQRLRGIGP